MKKKILDLDLKWWKDIFWQVFVAPILSGTVLIGYMYLIIEVFWPLTTAGLTGTTLIFASAPWILLALIGGLFIYMPLYSWFGGWDEHTLRDFKKCIPLTGPSIVVTYPLLKIAESGLKKSPFKNRGKLDMGKVAFEELLKLGKIRKKQLATK